MNEAREELAKVIITAYGEDAEIECPCEQDLDVAEAILAAGYRKPRTITTIEGLDALGEGAVILPQFGRTWRRGLIAWDNGIYRWSSTSIAAHGTLPATVLYEPEPQP